METFGRKPQKRTAFFAALLIVTSGVFTCNSHQPLQNKPHQISSAAGPAAPHTVDPQTKVDPQVLYHLCWEEVAKSFYDEQKLSNWSSWEHKFDGKLHTQEDADKAISEMLGSLGDPYTRFLDLKQEMHEQDEENGSLVGVGIAFGADFNKSTHKLVMAADGQPSPELGRDGWPLIKKVLPSSPAQAAGLQAGDQILALLKVSKKNGTTSRDEVSTRGLSLPALINLIHGPAGTTVEFELLRKGKKLDVAVVRKVVMVDSVHHKVLDGNLGYIRIDDFMQRTMINQLLGALLDLKDCRGLIIDLRYNPGGLMSNAIIGASLFLRQGHVIRVETRDNRHLDEETLILATDHMIIIEADDHGNIYPGAKARPPMLTSQPLVLIVNDGTASAAEIFTGALKDNGRAVVVGSKTFGKGIGQQVTLMPNGTALHVTTLRWFTPNDNWPGDGTGKGPGIQPNVTVKANGASSKDNQLQVAREQLEKLIKSGQH